MKQTPPQKTSPAPGSRRDFEIVAADEVARDGRMRKIRKTTLSLLP